MVEVRRGCCVIGCLANRNIWQNLSCSAKKSKDELTANSEWLIYSSNATALLSLHRQRGPTCKRCGLAHSYVYI
jgi:hypothetical protein